MGNFEFSNMLACDTAFVVEGIAYPTVEHYYQAAKLRRADVAGRRAIAALGSPYEAKRRCRTRDLERTGKLRPDWEQVKRAEMMRALRHKFARGTSWARRLVATTGEIVELVMWHDVYWGRCGCSRCRGAGRNELGRLLMALRAELVRGA